MKAGSQYDLLYPDDHIEVDPPLAFWIPELRRRYRRAKWVHLVRSEADCVESLANRETRTVRDFGRMLYHWEEVDATSGAKALYDVINGLCVELLPKTAFRLEVETAKEHWRDCWDWMGCQGDFEGSLDEWNTKHNGSS